MRHCVTLQVYDVILSAGSKPQQTSAEVLLVQHPARNENWSRVYNTNGTLWILILTVPEHGAVNTYK